MSEEGFQTARAELVARAKEKIAKPFTLSEELTFFCPQENLEALALPVVSRFHDWARERWQPGARGPAVLLLLACQRQKPYTLSREHQAVNARLLRSGFSPLQRGDWPQELAAASPPELLSNAPLFGGGLQIDRAVISEPFGLVPYEAIYRWEGEPSPCARYDDPGLFEHRGLACPWRDDCTAEPRGRRWVWKEAERKAYVEVHNRLAEQIAATLQRVAARYERIFAYVAPSLTHRTFLADSRERAQAGLPSARRTGGGRRGGLVGVGDLSPGLLTLVPSGAEIEEIRDRHKGRVPPGVLESAECLSLLAGRIKSVVQDKSSE